MDKEYELVKSQIKWYATKISKDLYNIHLQCGWMSYSFVLPVKLFRSYIVDGELSKSSAYYRRIEQVQNTFVKELLIGRFEC